MHAGDDLGDADEVHEVLGGAGRDVVDPGGEVDRPVDQDVEELVETEDDRRDGERDAQQRERLIARVAPVGALD